MPKFLLGFLVASSSLAQSVSSHDWSELTLRDPSKVVTVTSCGECHALEQEVWKATPHATGFKTLHRRESAEVIADRMGFKLIKRESLCLKCHYTAKVEKEQLRAVSGVSCESCHGAGRDWIDVHNNYGAGASRETETAQHKAERIAASRAAGMRRPSEIYDTAKSCFECHTVPEEELVNVGGHSTGSASFELVERSQGDIRHNFLGSLTGGSKENQPSTPERQRALYLGGRLLDLEYSLRGMAKATNEGTYSKAMSRRVRTAVSEVRAIAAAAELPEVDQLLAEVRATKVVVGAASALEGLALRTGEVNRRLLADQGVGQLASLDALISGEGAGDLPLDLAESGADPEGAATASSESTAGAVDGEVVSGSGTLGGAQRGGVPAEGEIKRFLRPRSSHRSLGPSACSGCHGDQNAWWFDDRHFASADPFFDQAPETIRIARLYGVSVSSMARGDSLCMDCHGSVVSGKERREVLDGVGCEACHGPAADWLEPHKEEEGQGRSRSGFVAALRLGKADLETLSIRAETCASCHYITDPRLLSAGHPSGEGYDFASGVASIRHWDRSLEGGGQLNSAYATAVAGRGPIPQVRLASLPEGSASVATSVRGGAASRRSPRPARTLVPRPRASGGPVADAEALDLGPIPPFPDVDPESSVEEVILLLKQRLEMLYGLVAAAEGQP